MNAFDIAVNSLFSDSNIAETATYIPLNNSRLSYGINGIGKNQVSVIVQKLDSFQNISSTFIATPTITLEVRVKDCLNLASGDKFVLNSITYTVQGTPKLDKQNLVWSVDLH